MTFIDGIGLSIIIWASASIPFSLAAAQFIKTGSGEDA